MIPESNYYNPFKFQLLEQGDIINENDEYYCPYEDHWLPVTDGASEIDEQTGATVYPNAWIGYAFESDESKPVRRKNLNYKP